MKCSLGNTRALYDAVTVLGLCFPTLLPTIDRFFPMVGGLESIFRFLAKSEGFGAHSLSNQLDVPTSLSDPLVRLLVPTSLTVPLHSVSAAEQLEEEHAGTIS